MRRRRPTPLALDPVTTGLWAVRWSTPMDVTAGDAMRAVPCLVCREAIGPGPAITVTVTHYVPQATVAGNLPTTAWLIHASHRWVDHRTIHDLAEWQLVSEPTRRTTA